MTASAIPGWLAGSEMGARIYAHDWNTTSLGALDTWPLSLKTAVGIMLRMPMPAMLLWGQELIQMYNDGHAVLIGKKHPACLGQPTRECCPEAWDFNGPIYDAVMQRGESFDFCDHQLTLNRCGTLEAAFFDLTYNPIYADDNAGASGVAGVMMTIRETTEQMRTHAMEAEHLQKRKQAEQALRESETKFRTLAEAAPALIWQSGADGKAVYMNSRYRDLTGKSPDEFLGMNWRGLLHPDDLRDYVTTLTRARLQRTAAKKRVRLKGKDGKWHWFESHSAPYFTANGQYEGHVGISLDISDSVQTHQELAISSEQLNLAIEGSGDGIFDLNTQTGEMVFSRRLWEMLGYSGQEVDERYYTLEKHLHPDDLPAVRAAFDACLHGVRPSFNIEYRVCCKDDSWKWLLVRAAVVAKDSDGKPLRITGMATDISEKRASEEIIWHHANYDTVTGLPNRRLFRDRLDQEIKKAHRTGLPLALMFIDLDRFKEVNDLLGHDAGDLLLIQASRRISTCVRESDTVARLGGDEFTAILSGLDEMAHVETIAQNTIDTLAQPFHLENEMVYITASIGITLYPSDADNAESLIRNADQAMYAAKDSGRNQFSYFTPLMQELAHNRLRLIGDLRNALSGDQFEVHYQPVIDLRSGRVTKAEALLRWQHPKMGMIEPLLFIPLAEESGLINDIGDWVFTKAAACSKIWGAKIGTPFQISVNKSPMQFLSRNRKIDWSQHLKDMGLAGNSISVEITEGVLLNASSDITDKLLQYRDAGIQVAIDDFGTGYSSLAYLKKFDIDYLKIDQSFVRDMATDTEDQAIVRSIVAMAHELDLKVIAEGIETLEQKDLLFSLGCDFGQGFYFSKAMPSDKFEQMLGQNFNATPSANPAYC